MMKDLNALQHSEEKKIAQEELNSYLEEVMFYYNIPDITTFSYRVKVPTVATWKEQLKIF